MHVKKIRAGGVPTTSATNFIGEVGTLFYDHDTGILRISDGHTPGGSLVYQDLSNIIGDIIPSQDVTYDLGSPSHQWRSLYVGTGTIYVQSTASSTSTTTGALIVTGGVGIGGNLYVGGEIVATKLTIQLTTVTTTLVQTDDIISTYNYTNATSTITGALQVAGGAGIGRDLYVGGIVTATTFVGSANPGTTSTTASALGYLGMPQLSTATSYTLVASDQGKHIYITATAQTITIPANTAVAFPIGTDISLIAGPSATSTTISITTDTMYLGGTGTTGNRTLAAYGMATLVKVAATTWYINGSGLT